MGGFANLIPTGVKEELGEIGSKMFQSMTSHLSESPAGKELIPVFKNYEKDLGTAVTHLTDAANVAIQRGLPAPEAGQIQNMAKNIAAQTNFGPNHAVITMAVNHAAKTNSPEYAANMLDRIAMYMKDTVPEEKTGRQISIVKKDVQKARMYKESKLKVDDSAVYSPPKDFERSAMNYSSTIQAPFIAIAHTGTMANLLKAPLADLTKGILRIASPGDYKATKTALINTGIFGDLNLQTYRDLQQFRAGKIAQWTGSPRLGEIIGKLTHAPGFNFVRDVTLTLAGATAKISAEKFARDIVAKPGDRLAQLNLEKMQLNPGEIIKQGGKLTPDQLEKAVYHFVNNHAFLKSNLDRSYWANKNMATRMATMYHSYVIKQAKYIRDAISEANYTATSNPAHALKIWGMLLIAFPAIGSVIEGLEDYGRGEDGLKNTEKRYERLFGHNGKFQAVEQYGDFLSHLGGFGIASNYTRGLLRNRLAETIAGPLGSAAFHLSQDTGKPLVKELEGKNKNTDQLLESLKPLGRDVLSDILPDNIGRMLSHKLLPTRQELEDRGEGPRAGKLQGLKGLKGFKKFKNFN